MQLCPRTELNTLRPRQNCRYFPDNILKWIFLNENVWISTNISLKSVPRGPINNITTLIQVMAWRRPGDKPLSKAMMVRLPTHICVTQPQWVKQNLMDGNPAHTWNHFLVITAPTHLLTVPGHQIVVISTLTQETVTCWTNNGDASDLRYHGT